MDVNYTERRPAEGTQRGSAATCHHTWALPTTLAGGLPEKWEGVGQKESRANRGLQNIPSREDVLGSSLLGPWSSEAQSLPHPHHMEEGNDLHGCHFFTSSNASGLITVFPPSVDKKTN